MKMAANYDSANGIFEGFEPYTVSGVTITDQELGTGAYATVLKVKYMGLKCAGKKIHTALLGHGPTISYTVQRFRNECEILSHVRHPNIVQFLGVYFQQGINIPILLMEFLPLNLTQCLSSYHLRNKVSYSILHDVALGLNYLHSQPSPIVHRDLSSNNVLLASNMTAKISDLGVARILDYSSELIHLTQTPGTPAFMPPEVKVAKPVYDTSVDEFSYGIVMIHVLSGKWPEPQLGPIRTEEGKLIPVSEAERRADFLLAIGEDHPLIDLILKCIHNSPQMRAHSTEIVKKLADMVKSSSSSFTNQLDMIDHIRKLEKENMTLRSENEELIKRHRKVLVQQRKQIISKLERKQEQDNKMINQFIHDLKSSLSEDVQQGIDHLHHEEPWQDKSLLQCQVNRLLSEPHEQPHVKTRSKSREGSDTGKPTHVRASSDTLHPLLKHGLKPKKGGKSMPTEICSLSDYSKSQSASLNGESCDTDKTDSAEIRTSTKRSYTSNSGENFELVNSLKSVIGVSPLLVSKQEECTALAMSSPSVYRKKTRKRSKSTNTDEKESVTSKHERQSSWSHPRSKFVSIDSVSHVVLSNVDHKHGTYTSPELQKSRSSDESKVPPRTITLSKDKLAKSSKNISPEKLENQPQSEHGAVRMSPDTQIICASSSNEENLLSTIKKEKDRLVQGKGQKHAVPDAPSVRGSSIQKHAKHKRLPHKEPRSQQQKDDNTRPSLYTQRCRKVSESKTSTVCDSSISQNQLKDLTSDDLLYPIHATLLDYNVSPMEFDLMRGDQMYMKSKTEGKCGKRSS